MRLKVHKLCFALFAALVLVVGGVTLLAQTPQQGDQSQTTSNTAKKTTKQKTDASSKDAATSAAPASKAPSSNAPASKTTASGASAKPQTPAEKSAGMVWVSTDSGVYHKPGTRWYGKTKQGKYMLEADAIKAGYKPAKERGGCKAMKRI